MPLGVSAIAPDRNTCQVNPYGGTPGCVAVNYFMNKFRRLGMIDYRGRMGDKLTVRSPQSCAKN